MSDTEERAPGESPPPGASPASPPWRRLVALVGSLDKSDRAAASLLWVSRLVVVTVLGAYLAAWISANHGMLFDPDLQNDDARTILFPFHRYGSQGTLAGDPIAEEMLSAVPWGVRILYMAFVPVVDVYVAAKLVQFVALGIFVWAAVVLARSRRTGLAVSALLVFLVLHTTFATDRLGGGLPRAFGFPCFALWLAGLLAQKRVPRFAAPVILALSYPSIMNLILAAEGILALRGILRVKWSVVGRRLRRYAILVGACLLCALPAALGDSDRGPIHTLEQAEKEPAFGRSGRLWILPFAEPVDAVTDAFFDPVTPKGRTPLSQVEGYKMERGMIAVLVVAFFFVLAALRLGPLPGVAGAFFAGTAVIYALSRIYAFSLYSPERYYSFGMRMACLAFLVASSAHLYFWMKPRLRSTLRNFTIAAFMGALWLVTGDGLEKDSGIEISRATDRPLYDFIRKLPKDVRFATHVLDGDGVPFWGARAHTGSFETLQPWFVDSWARQKERMNATLSALYATDEAEVLAFAEQHGVTHFLVNRSRYRADFKRKAGSFEPFSAETSRLLRKTDQKDLVFSRPPSSAVVFQHGRFQVVGVAQLQEAWKKAP